jgi:hypothetical protein
MNGSDRATLVVVQESGAVLELIEQALRDDGDIDLATRGPFEAVEVVPLVRLQEAVREELRR